jgi:hypothetical protein
LIALLVLGEEVVVHLDTIDVVQLYDYHELSIAIIRVLVDLLDGHCLFGGKIYCLVDNSKGPLPDDLHPVIGIDVPYLLDGSPRLGVRVPHLWVPCVEELLVSEEIRVDKGFLLLHFKFYIIAFGGKREYGPRLTEIRGFKI